MSKKKKKSSKATAVMAATASTIAAASVDYNRIVSLYRENCFAATRQHQSRFFKCHDLIGDTLIFAMKFSTDGSYIVSGGGDKTVRLWSLCDVDNEETQGTTSVHQMKAKHKSGVCCVAISPDNSRIFSSGDFDSKLFVHDART